MGLPIRWEQYPEGKVTESIAPRPSRRRRPARRLRALCMICAVLAGFGVVGFAIARAHDALTEPSAPVLRLAPTAGTEGQVRLASATAVRRLGFVTITGNVVNTTVNEVKDVEAVAELLDSQGRTVGVESALVVDSALPPRQGSPFQVVVNDNAQAVSYRIGLRRLMGGML